MIGEEPIFALATPEGSGGVAMIRASGDGCGERLRHWLGEVQPWQPRTARSVAAPCSDDRGQSLLPGVVVWYPSRASYTGEEALELFLPAVPPLLSVILSGLVEAGLRPAHPGEFTRRAYLNGRFDLIQAESVSQIIAAEDRQSAAAARRALDGELGAEITRLGSELHDLLALLEAGLDFADQEVDPPDGEWLAGQLNDLIGRLRQLAGSSDRHGREESRVRVLIHGAPNAGKSTLLNRLAGREVAITSSIPGTTRDPLLIRLQRRGCPSVELVDLAGTQEGETAVERSAQELARQWLQEGDAVLYLLDGSRSVSRQAREWQRLSAELRDRSWPVVSKIDLFEDRVHKEAWARRLAAAAGLRVPPELISAVSGEGVDLLLGRIWDHAAHGGWTSRGNTFLFTARQLAGLDRCAGVLARAAGELGTGPVDAPELFSIELREAASHLEEVTGALCPEETLDRIFQRFCLGK